MLNFPILCDLFRFSAFYCTNEGKMFKKWIILKRSKLPDMTQNRFRDHLFNVTLICVSLFKNAFTFPLFYFVYYNLYCLSGWLSGMHHYFFEGGGGQGCWSIFWGMKFFITFSTITCATIILKSKKRDLDDKTNLLNFFPHDFPGPNFLLAVFAVREFFFFFWKLPSPYPLRQKIMFRPLYWCCEAVVCLCCYCCL